MVAFFSAIRISYSHFPWVFTVDYWQIDARFDCRVDTDLPRVGNQARLDCWSAARETSDAHVFAQRAVGLPSADSQPVDQPVITAFRSDGTLLQLIVSASER